MKRMIAAMLLVLLTIPALAQDGYFGKNKVKYKNFRWEKITTENFEIYYYQGGRELAQVAARMAENAGRRISQDMGHTLYNKIPIVLYTSHNDFAQTNIAQDIIDEGVGGFTTLLKNRVVVPYTGSYADLDHVITHELVHAFMFDLFFGKSMESIFSQQSLMQLPLWFVEGMAEYESRGWDPETEMIIKDLALNQRLIPIQELEGYGGSYFVYKEGQAIIKFIVERYGQQKIGEMFHMLKSSRSMDNTCEKLLGSNVEKLSELWLKDMHKKYWPYLAAKKEVPDFAKQLTEHDVFKTGSYFNLAPCFSPQGDKIAYISDQDGRAGIYIISSIDGHRIKHLVKGEQNAQFEAMHLAWFRGGLSWSPDGKKLTFAAKSTTGDKLYVVRVDNGKILKKLEFPMDGIYYPSWSPASDKIAFCGLKDGQSDLYVADIADSHNVAYSLERLTDDQYDDREPEWSPDGRELVFVSDRPAGEDQSGLDTMYFGRYRLFSMDPVSGSIGCLTPEETMVSRPSWSPKGIAYTAIRRGVSNIFAISGDSTLQLTDAITGCLQSKWSRDGSKLVFIGYHKTGWNIFTIKNPLDKLPGIDSQKVFFWASADTGWYQPRKFEQPLADSNRYKPGQARTKFSVDWAQGSFNYNTLSGLGGQAEIVVSDVMGNHQFYWLSDMVINLQNSDYQLTYFYRPRRWDYGISYYQYHNYYLASNNDIIIEKINGVQGILSYPFNRYQRIDFMGSWSHYNEELYHYENYQYYTSPDANLNVIIPAVSLVHDNVQWSYYGPREGRRAMAAVEASSRSLGSDLNFVNYFTDIRQYWPLTKRSEFALRLMGGLSMGSDAQYFELGGPYTLRAYDYNELDGTRMALMNLELRVPFVDRIQMAIPPISFYGIRGAMFFDIGAAWSDSRQFQLFQRDPNALLKMKDLNGSLGTGIRMIISPFMMKLDFSWKTDLSSISDKARISFVLGSEY
jgi:Tol biopolymer transport system component